VRHQLLQPSDDVGAHQLGAPFAGRKASACGDAEDARAESCFRLPPVLQKVQDEGFADGARALRARRCQERGEDQTGQATASGIQWRDFKLWVRSSLTIQICFAGCLKSKSNSGGTFWDGSR